MQPYPYRESKQIERYISQIMRVFSGFQTRDNVGGEPKNVPVVYGNMSRLVAHLLKKGDGYINNKVPMFAVNLGGIEIDQERSRNFHHREHFNTRKWNPDDPKNVDRIVGPAFNLNVEVSVYASSISELLDIVEQVLLIFNPRLTIQVDSSVYNSDYITEISIDSIQPDIQYPMGTDKRIVSLTMNLSVPVRLSYPRSVDEDSIIEQIRLNIFDQSRGDILLETIIPEEEQQ